LQPVANDVGAPTAIFRPFLRKAAVDHVIVLDAERVLDDLGSAVPVIAIDGLLKQVSPWVRLTAPRTSAFRVLRTLLLPGLGDDALPQRRGLIRR
jgi:hypothetical protein